MARNGAGSYSLPVGNPVVTQTTITSTWANTTLSDIATALTGSIAADGQTTPTANIPMGGFKITNLLQGSATTDAAAIGSPTFLGTPAAPTAAVGTNTTQIATTAFVAAQAFLTALPLQTGNSGKTITTDGSTASWTLFGTAGQTIAVNAAGTALEGIAPFDALSYIQDSSSFGGF